MAGLLNRTEEMSKKMAILLRTIFLLLLFLVNFSATAQLVLKPLTGVEIQKFVFGSTMSGEYPSGERWAEQFNTDGTSEYSESGILSHGTMSLNGNILCFTYPDKPTTGGCFEVWKRGPNCFDFYTPTGLATLDQRQFGKAWDARAWYANQTPTCISEQIS